MASQKITWQAYEHNHTEKSSDWFWGLGIVAVAGAILAIYFDNLLFALLILIAAFALMLQAHSKPKLMTFGLGGKGVYVNDRLFTYSSLDAFWVIDEEIDDKIIFKSKKSLMPLIIFPFDSNETDTDEIREFLAQYLLEDELHEPFHQKLMEAIGL